MTNALNPCPFCGSKYLSGGYNNSGGMVTTCDNCQAMGPASEPTTIGIVTAWNTRATPTLSAAVVLPEVQALVAAAERLAEWAEQLRACGDAGSWEWAAGDEYSETIAALVPFTEATL
jgi:Lar family restriction alleviation protein